MNTKKILAALASALLITGCDNSQLDRLKAENDSLRAEVHDLKAENEEIKREQKAILMIRERATRATSQAAFSQLAIGILKYKQIYGFYPDINPNRGQYTTNQDTAHLLNGNAGYCHNFIKAMSGKQVNGSALAVADRNRFNRYAEEFYAFAKEDYFDLTAAMAGNPVLIDRFGNHNIRLIFDTDNNGVIKNIKITDVPAELKGITTEEGVRARVIIFSKGATADQDVIAVI